MIHHVILWQLKDEIKEGEKAQVAADIKQNLEALVGVVPGLVSLKIVADPMPSSNADVMLDSVLENEEALKVYQTHEEHVKVADKYVRPFTKVRMCMDYKE